MNGKDIRKYAIVDCFQFQNEEGRHYGHPECNSNELADVIAEAEKNAAEYGRDVYIAQLIRVVEVKKPAVETEVVVVK